LGTWKFVWGAKPTKVPHGDGTVIDRNYFEMTEKK